jgi:glycolate oxidase FAD binding subunit
MPLRARYDWGGGLVWLLADAIDEAAVAQIREAATTASGTALLVRATEAIRARVGAFPPPAPGLATLSARIRANTDPHGIFNPGLMG